MGRFCEKCGTQLPERAAFCNRCGAPVNAKNTGMGQSINRQSLVTEKEKKSIGGKLAMGLIVVCAVTTMTAAAVYFLKKDSGEELVVDAAAENEEPLYETEDAPLIDRKVQEQESQQKENEEIADEGDGTENKEKKILKAVREYYIDYNTDEWYLWSYGEYDEVGNETKKVAYNSDGSIDWWYEYEYDKVGNIIYETRYKGSDGSALESCGYENEYDEVGNKIMENGYTWGMGGWNIEYEYDETGNLKKEMGDHLGIMHMCEYEWAESE